MASPQLDDVIVIGAGLSGLHAALVLEAQGMRVQVIEAQERVGGRIHSMRQLGSNAEAGATYIGAGCERIMAAARRHGVELINVTPLLEFFREQQLVLGGEIIRQSEWPTHPANPFPDRDKQLLPWNFHRVLTMRENPLGSAEEWLAPERAALDVSLRSWMQGLGLGERVVEVGYNINPSFGASADDVSALMLFFRAAFSKAQRKLASEDAIGYTARNGVQSLPEAMARALRRDIHFGRVATAIETGAAGAQVRCADGSRYRSRRVLCSVPFSVLRGMALDPPLQGPQAEAVAELPAQPVTQVYLAAKKAFWEEDGYAPSLFTDSLAGMVAAARNGLDPAEITSFTAWVMGPNAARLDALPDDEAAGRVIEAIERIRPAAKGNLELIGLQSWGKDPFAAGAWAYFKPGQIRRFAATMGASHGRVHFCGEHLAATQRGMEGAMESAERAAAEILALSSATAR